MKRKKYTNEFKAEAVNLVRQQGLAVSRAARDLWISETTLHNWLGRDRVGLLDPESPQRQEREIVKKPRPSSPSRASKICLYCGAHPELSSEEALPRASRFA